MGYTLHVLDDKQFDALRIKNPRYQTEDALGFADVKAKTAYIRRTGINTLDQFVTAHELEELVSKYSDHEIDGIRYKKGGAARQIVPALLALVPGVGPVLSAAATVGMNQYAKTRHPEELGKPGQPLDIIGEAAQGYFGGKAIAGGVSGGIAGGTEAAAGFGNKAIGIAKGVGQGAGSALGFGSTPATTAGGISIVPNASAPSNLPNVIGMNNIPATAGGAPGVGTVISKVPGAAANATLPSGANALNVANTTGMAAAAKNPLLGGAFSTTPSPTNINWASPSTNLPNAIPNTSYTTGTLAGSPATDLGFQNPTSPTSPTDVTKKPGIVDRVWDKFNSPLGSAAVGAAVPLIGSAFSPKVEPYNPQESQMYNEVAQRVKSGAPKLTMTPEQKTAIAANYDNQLELGRQEIINRWKAARPGSDITNDTQLQQALRELESEFAIEKANAITSTELGLTQQQTEMMSELAAFDVNTLAQKAGIQAQEAKEFKQMLQDMGFMVAGNPQSMGYQRIYSGNQQRR